MSDLSDYIMSNAERGACVCGKCADAPKSPESLQPDGHAADMIFFEVSAKDGAKADDLKQAILSHRGVFNELNMFDGKSHSFLEIGGYVGDQGLALMLMGLGSILGIWALETPKNMLPGIPRDLMVMMAERGMIMIKAHTKTRGEDDPELVDRGRGGTVGRFGVVVHPADAVEGVQEASTA